MRKIAVFLVAVLVAGLLAACGSSSPQRSEPFVGQWESTGGEKIALVVSAPTDGNYPVQVTGGGVDVKVTAQSAGDMLYKAAGAKTDWVFRLTDDSLMTATVTPKGGTGATTTFKRVGD